jgi:hypothetical protein
MDSLPDLDRLSVTEKDELIRALIARVQTLTAEMAALTAKVAELEGRLAQNRRHSSQPPSSDGDGKPKPKSLRKAGPNPTGGQKGHPGHRPTPPTTSSSMRRRPPAMCAVRR